MGEDDEGKKSKFNSGVALAERIDALQRASNAASYNPLGRNIEVGRWNYEIMITSQDLLLKEAWAKMLQKERDEADKIKKLIHGSIKYRPILLESNGELRTHKINYELFLELFDLYEKKVKIYLDKHNLNAPDSEEDEGL